MFDNFLIAFLTTNFVKKHVNTKELIPRWHSYFESMPYAIVFAFLIDILIFSDNKIIEHLLWIIIIGALLFLLRQMKSNRLAKILSTALLPYFVIYTLRCILAFLVPDFYSNHRNFFELLKFASYLWMLAFSIGASNQQKALAKEEEKNKAILKQKESLEALVSERTAEIMHQKESLEKTLEELQETQEQLIQREKMASLGELTAGIAHEIQNPLNFVNNFSELSKELVQELNEEIEKPQPDFDLIKDLLKDITQNQEKINHHGKRASNIVKGMLEHSRTSTGVKELINVNDLIEEFLPLSYHGMRAKDKTFNANFKMNLDKSLQKVEAVPQDIGRVFLNLFNNAFYAVNKKSQMVKAEKTTENTENYSPTVEVTTEMGLDEVTIKVSDNGTGVPENLKQKIFQPFFTTKPTGEGTGLGLSLSFDIITKGHSGEMEVESTEGVGTVFIVKLPV